MRFPLSSLEKQAAMAFLSRNYGDWCAKCGSRDNLTIDHILPRTAGGSDELDNLQILCASCNATKSDRIVSDGFAYNWSKRHSERTLEKFLDHIDDRIDDDELSDEDNQLLRQIPF